MDGRAATELDEVFGGRKVVLQPDAFLARLDLPVQGWNFYFHLFF